MYAQREPFTRLLLGSENVLLRPEFLAEPRSREHAPIGRKVLVTMGGSDSDNVTGKVVAALSKVNAAFEAKIVVGAGYSQAHELQLLADRMAQKVQLERSPANMAPLMRWADVAISGAGGTCWELAYLGLPSIVIALSRDQQGIAKGLADREIALSLGWHANLSEGAISDALTSLLSDHERRLAMSERGQALVDGQGAARVVKFLKDS